MISANNASITSPFLHAGQASRHVQGRGGKSACVLPAGDVLVLRFGESSPDYQRKIRELVAEEADRIPPNIYDGNHNTGRERVRWFYEILSRLQQTHPASTESEVQSQMFHVLEAVEKHALRRPACDWTNADGTCVVNAQKGQLRFFYHPSGAYSYSDPVIVEHKKNGKTWIRKIPKGSQSRDQKEDSGIFFDNTHGEFIFCNTRGAIQICRKTADGFWGTLKAAFKNGDLLRKGVWLDHLYQRVVFEKAGMDGKDVWGNTPQFSENPRSPFVAEAWRVRPRDEDPNVRRNRLR